MKDSTKPHRSIPLNYQLVIIIGFIAVFYQLFSLSKSIYNDTSVDRYNERERQEIERHYEETVQKKKSYVLKSFDSFWEREGKETKNLINDGEVPIVIHGHDTEKLIAENNVAEETLAAEMEAQQLDPFIASMPVSKQWMYFFFEIR